MAAVESTLAAYETTTQRRIADAIHALQLAQDATASRIDAQLAAGQTNATDDAQLAKGFLAQFPDVTAFNSVRGQRVARGSDKIEATIAVQATADVGPTEQQLARMTLWLTTHSRSSIVSLSVVERTNSTAPKR